MEPTATTSETLTSVDVVHTPANHMEVSWDVTSRAVTDAVLQELATANLDCFELIAILHKLDVTPDEMMTTLDFYIEHNGESCDLVQGRVGNRVFYTTAEIDPWTAPTTILALVVFS